MTLFEIKKNYLFLERLLYLTCGDEKCADYMAKLKENGEYKLEKSELEKIKSISNLAEIVLKHLLTENILKFDYDETLQKALTYIDANLDKDLSIKSISKGINVSKSALYSKFHSLLNCTIGEHINKRRIEKSIQILIDTNLSIEEVSQSTGFSSASYFTKIFKQHTGITPLKYRKSKTKNK